VDVVRNNVEIADLSMYDQIVLSPGPGLPEDAGCLMSTIAKADGKIPVLGVCLGMQAIAVHLGGELYNQQVVKHGVQEEVTCMNSTLFKDLPEKIEVGLYHSWAVKPCDCYQITATSSSEIIMGIENAERQLYGVQFHPESVMTPKGMEILKNFMR